MSNSTEEHLANITAEELIAFKYSDDSFKSFASSVGGGNSVYLGIIGTGQYSVKHNGVVQSFEYANQAIELYTSIIK